MKITSLHSIKRQNHYLKGIPLSYLLQHKSSIKQTRASKSRTTLLFLIKYFMRKIQFKNFFLYSLYLHYNIKQVLFGKRKLPQLFVSEENVPFPK